MAVPYNSTLMDALEPRRLMAKHAVAVMFNDEALWDANFNTAVAQAKQLNVTAVRVWLRFEGFNDRPRAYDPTVPFGQVFSNDGTASTNDAEQVMRRVFDLYDNGFSVMLTVNDGLNSVPASATHVKALYQHLMNATQYPGGGRSLKDVVDYWEIGNEPDSGSYWAPSASNKTAGLQSYVDKLLIPAGQALHAAGESVVSAGPSSSPNDLKTILDRLKSQNQLSAIDYAGFHPYGTHTVGGASQILTNTKNAAYLAQQAGKPMMATEWNVRGYGNTGANDATWANAMSDAYRQAILPYYDVGYYFALINNWPARGGSTSARPGGLLKHAYGGAVVPKSPVATLKAYYESALVAAQPFWGKVDGWVGGTTVPPPVTPTPTPTNPTNPTTPTVPTNGTAVVSGKVFAELARNNAAVNATPWTIFVDADNDGVRDANELFRTTNGVDTNYSFTGLAAGTYTLVLQQRSGLTVTKPSPNRFTLTVKAGQARSGNNFVVRPV